MFSSTRTKSTASTNVTHFVVKIFRISGIWTECTINRIVSVLILGTLHFVSGLLLVDTWIYRDDVINVTESLYSLFCNIMVTSKVYFVLLTSHRLQELTNILDETYSCRHMHAEMAMAADKALRLSRNFFYFCFFTAIGFIFYPALDQLLFQATTPFTDQGAIGNSTVEAEGGLWPFPFRVWTPWDQTRSPFFEITYILISFHCTISGAHVPGIDVLLSTCILLTSGLLRVVNERVKVIVHRFALSQTHEIEWTNASNTDFEEDTEAWGADDGFLAGVMIERNRGGLRHHGSFEKELGRIVREHQAIMEFVSRLNDIFSSFMMLTFSWCVILICVVSFQCLLIEVNSLKFALKVAYASAIVLEVYLLCWSGQQLLDESYNIAEAVYSSSWYLSKPSVRKMLFHMQMRSQKPLQIYVGKFAVLSIDTFVQIMRSAYSYLAVLKNLAE